MNRKNQLMLPPLTSKKSDAVTRTKLSVTYARLPLHFEPNQGQTDEQVNFLARGKGYALFLTSTEAVLALRKPAENSPAPVSGSLSSPLPRRGRTLPYHLLPPGKEPDPELIEQTVLRMKLVGANPNPRVAGQEELPGKVNYFLGNDPAKWRTDIPTYARVEYQHVYPGVNLVYYGNQRQLEYDLVVAPGANPNAITLDFQDRAGRDLPLRIDAQGDLVLQTEGGEVRLLKPYIYQDINGAKHPISGSYVLLSPQIPGSGLGTRRIGLEVAAYDTSKPLVIDPVLSYSTYLGGSGDDGGRGIAVDTLGNAYVTGFTTSTNFPTASPLQPALGGGFEDTFVAKVDLAVETPLGTNVVVQPIDATTGTTPVSLTFSSVSTAGTSSLMTSSAGPPPPNGFSLGSPPTYYELTTTALFSGPITVCIDYSGISFIDESQLKLFHFEGGVWIDHTVSLDTSNNIICASVDSLSPFAVFEGTQAPTCATNVSALVSVTRKAFHRNHATGRYVQRVTLKNTSSVIQGPVSLVLDGLSSNATLFNASGTTSCATPVGPYVMVNVGSDNVLTARERASVVLEFTNRTHAGIIYSTRVLAGPNAR